MQSQYLEEITRLLRQTRPRLAATHRLEFKTVFGAVGGYANGHIFISCGNFGVALKLPPNVLKEIFKEAGVKPLRYFPNGHVKKEYAVLSERILDNKDRLKKLVGESISYVLQEGDSRKEHAENSARLAPR